MHIHHRVPWGLWLVIIHHAVWAVILMIEPANAKPVTALHHMSELIPSHFFCGVVLLCVSAMAWWAVHHEKSEKTLFGVFPLSLAMLVPQQLILVLSATGSVFAICAQQFPDGYPSPWNFILKDQSVNILIAILHTLNLVEVHFPVAWDWLTWRAD